jgi:hypothetical protein
MGVMQYQAQQEQADAQARAYERQAEAEEANARYERRAQEQIADNAARETENLKHRQRLIAGQTRAQAGAAGLSLSGSPLDILSSGYDAYEQDKETALANQRNANFDKRVSESNFLNAAAGHRASADNVREAAKWQGAATILGTAASIYGNIGGSGGSSAGSSSAGSSFNAPKSISSSVGTNTTANWTLNSGYTFTPTKTVGSWGNTLNTGNFGRTNYFGYR